MSAPRWVAITPGDGRALWPWLKGLLDVHPLTVVVREPTGAPADLATRIRDHGGRCIWHEKTPEAPPGLPRHLTALGPPSAGRWSRSCHDAASLTRALEEGADWCTLSPVYPPGSKPDDTRPTLGPETFLKLAKGRPVVALGGLNPSRAQHLLRRGARGVEGIGLFFGHPNPSAAARNWGQLLETTRA